MSKRNLPEKLQQKQEAKRQESIELVQNAINELKAEGCKVTMTALVERTGLARATLSNTHTDKVLKNNKVCKYEKLKVLNTNENKVPRTKADFELAIAESMVKINSLTEENTKLRNMLNAEKVSNYELKKANSKLLSELQILSQKARMKGVRLELLRSDNS
jgi:hypothetical protein